MLLALNHNLNFLLHISLSFRILVSMLVQFIVLELLKIRCLYDSTQCISQSLQLRLRLSMLCSRIVHHCTLKLYHSVLCHQQPFNCVYFVLTLAINSMSAISDDSEIVVSSSVIYVIFCWFTQ